MGGAGTRCCRHSLGAVVAGVITAQVVNAICWVTRTGSPQPGPATGARNMGLSRLDWLHAAADHQTPQT